MTTSTERPGGPGPDSGAEQTPWAQWDEPSGQWLLPGSCPDTRERTLILEAAARLLFPTVLVYSLYLLVEGHYGPGGGFAGGLVAGLAFVLRHIAGGNDDLGPTFRLRPAVIAGSGLIVSLLTGLLPVLWGQPVFASTKWSIPLGPLGELDVVSSLFFDIGVYLLIIGVVLDLLRSLGSGIARDAREAGEGPGEGR